MQSNISSDILPDLPKKLVKREASLTPKVLKWFREHYNNSCAIEIKATAGNTIAEKALEPHQRKALFEARNGTLVHKISDVGHIRLPFDAFMLRKTDAFVVACFKAHGYALVYDIADWKGCRYTSGDYKFKIPL